MNVTNDYVENFHNPIVGCIFLIQGTLYLIPYTPCAIVMARRPLIHNNCYKIMFSMAVIDFIALFVGSYWCGVASILGWAMSTFYFENMLAGAIANGCWYGYCALNYVLALNRIAELHSIEASKLLFGKHKIYVWIIFTLVYALWGFIVMLTLGSLVYHSGHGVLLFDPYNGTNDQKVGLAINRVNNWMTAIVLPLMYLVVYALFRQKTKVATNKQKGINKKEKLVILQSFLISSLTVGTCVSYVSLPYFVSDVRWYFVAHIIWQATQGMNCFIYLGLNRSIRREVKRLFMNIGEASSSGAIRLRVVGSSTFQDQQGTYHSTNGTGLMTLEPSRRRS